MVKRADRLPFLPQQANFITTFEEPYAPRPSHLLE